MHGLGALWVFGAALLFIAGCSAATPKPRHVARVAEPVPSDAPMQRDLYSQRLIYLLRRGWRPPTDLRVAPMTLKTTAEVDIDAFGSFVAYRLAESSGDERFDISVTAQLQALIDAGARAESGPPYIVDHVYGETLKVRFNGPPPPGSPPF
jgi:hypothetical protein